MAGDSAGPSELTDVDRSGIAVVANLIAIIAFLLADGVCLHWPAEWGSARWVVHTGCVIFALYFLIVAGGWRSFVGSMRRARAENGGSARGGARAVHRCVSPHRRHLELHCRLRGTHPDGWDSKPIHGVSRGLHPVHSVPCKHWSDGVPQPSGWCGRGHGRRVGPRCGGGC